jgi:hypothetical protein
MVARYLQIFWQLFRVGGLVAPVFVVISFLSSSPARPLLRWVGIAGIVWLAILGVCSHVPPVQIGSQDRIP